MRRVLIALLVAPATLALAVALAPATEAAEVRLDGEQWGYCKSATCPPGAGYSERLIMKAGRGEANRVTVARGAAGQLQVTDPGARLRAAAGCTASGEHRVDCPTSSPQVSAYVYAGDRDDKVSSAVEIYADGGRGNDRLSGSPGGDALYGGEGRDVLRAGAGDDALVDGRLRPEVFIDSVRWSNPPQSGVTYQGRLWYGAAWIREALGALGVDAVRAGIVPAALPVRAERDFFDGGTGADTLGYVGRRRGLLVDLASRGRHAGERGEGDSIRGVDGVIGGSGNDRLFGTDAINLLQGEAGDDLLVGRAGNDMLKGGDGWTRARGDAGDDDITVGEWYDRPRGPGSQQVACGRGRDEIRGLSRNDLVEDDCERIMLGPSYFINQLLPPAHWQQPPLLSYTTFFGCEGPPCSLRLEVRLARSPDRRRPRLKGLLLAEASATIPVQGERATLTANLSERGIQLLRRYRRLLIRVHYAATEMIAGGTTSSGMTYLTRLRAPSR